ncbi:TetR/AcrR family transcriptional regulator [Streptomyces sp. NPDC059949]|uniref:TetR/AcrR family transcriptional regulator n=1 Tax=unclassified Streptomyces TaxID=2593676 RepID=UPI00364D93F3
MTTTDSSGSGDISRSLELLWGAGQRPSRGPKPGLTLEKIIDKAVATADTEGLEAVSMRRLSTELGVGTMSLYRYLPGKAELLDLMLDRVQKEAHAALEGARGWRAALEATARAALALYHRHPWLLHVNQARPVLGPNAVRHLERTLARINTMNGLTDQELISVIVTLDGYVAGVARTHVNAVEAERHSGISEEQFWQAQTPVLSRAMATGEFPLMAALDDNAFSGDFDHFAFGLERLLDGFEALVAARTATRPS